MNVVRRKLALKKKWKRIKENNCIVSWYRCNDGASGARVMLHAGTEVTIIKR